MLSTESTIHDISNQDVWLIVSAGRTGSVLISQYIQGYYGNYFKNEKFKFPGITLDDVKDIDRIESPCIYHTHNPNCLFHEKIKDINVVHSTRNLVDIVTSQYVRDTLGIRSHVYENLSKSKIFKTTTKRGISIDREKIKLYCDDAKIRHESILKAIKKVTPKKLLEIDYTQFSNDVLLLSDILGFPKKIDVNIRIKKMPDYREKIKNYFKLTDLIKFYLK